MFTTPAPSAPTLSATTTTVAPAPSSQPRPSRLRDLSASLRSYTHSLSHPASPPAPSRADARAPRDPPQTANSNYATTTPPISPSFAPPTQSSTATTERSSLSRTRTAPEASDSRLPVASSTMTRNRAETAGTQLTVRNQSGPTPASTPQLPSMESTDGQAESAAGNKSHLPSIRLIPHQDPRAGRPSLQFATISRTLPEDSAVIKVGRYSERENAPEIPANHPSAAAVGFKSKVVSRKHCELWCKDSQWYIKDVKSSSGTFLNHIRLSSPNVESKPFKLKDGDIIQLGIDFRGGEEMIFRCVKIRVECNRGWQQALNTFNKQTHQRLRNLAKKTESDAASTHASECSICLMSIAPCQSLFVAPCSHVWHYKCIRPILNGPTWPNFLCPNCRAVTDLEADVEDPGEYEDWDDGAVNGEGHENGGDSQEDRHVTPRTSTVPLNNPSNSTSASGMRANGQIDFTDLETAISNINIADSLNGITNQPVPAPETPHRFLSPAPSSSITQPVPINITGNDERSGLSPLFHNHVDGLSADRAPDCPMTPRNDAGPFVFDGSAGRGPGTRPREDDSPSSGNTAAPTLPPLHMD